MRITGLLLVLVCFVATPLSGSAQEAPRGDATMAIRALEYERVEARSRNDNRALDLIFDNALVYIEHGRLMTKGDYLLGVRSGTPQLQQIVMEAMTVRTFGSTAIVVGTYRDKSVSTGRAHLERRRFVDTWVYKKGRWMLVEAAAAPLSK
jgi:hypothetical protein